jgi:hypothetical protein
MSMFDFSINLGNILTLVGFAVGGILFVMMVKSDVRDVSTRFDQGSEHAAAQIEDLKMDVRELNKLTTELGRVAVAMEASTGRFNLIDERLTAQGKRLDDALAQIRQIRHAT